MSSAKKPHHRRETFNQIVLMLILAFTLRVFVVEAFVIPTGSMAPTLKGAHCRFVCENCSYAFDTNYSSPRSSAADINIPRVAQERTTQGIISNQVFRVFCPNCGFEIGQAQSVGPRVYYGDRILVLKYAYMLKKPQRWDVVVFKTPADPKIHHYGQAYIKRLIGTPGEQIMILDGDIYVAPSGATSDLDWKIQTKPQIVQDALWRIVHDIDYAPKGLTPESKGDEQTPIQSYIPWRSDSKNWVYTRDTTGTVAFNFDGLKSSGALTFDRTVGRDKASLSDWMAYDQVPPPGQSPLNPVSDLKLSLFYSRVGGSGPLELFMSKRNDLFIASIDATSASLYRARLDAPENRKLIGKLSHAFGATPTQLDFQNVDYRVSLCAGGRELLATTPQEYAPDVTALKGEYTAPPYPNVAISADSQVCSITHMSLWRDVFYTTVMRGGNRIIRGTWDNPVKLGADEYFTLGDNSPLSQDGRFWEDPVKLPLEDVDAQAGVVPGRFMLGKALLVYWPAGFRLYHPNAPDLIPNFGELRFIH